jgi:UDP-glucose 4-epimerase
MVAVCETTFMLQIWHMHIYRYQILVCFHFCMHVKLIRNQALEFLKKENKSERFNLGSGKGYSVLEIIEAARKVTGHPIPVKFESRRAGDATALIASSQKAEKLLGWRRKFENVEDIIRTAWNFHVKHPNGFK